MPVKLEVEHSDVIDVIPIVRSGLLPFAISPKGLVLWGEVLHTTDISYVRKALNPYVISLSYGGGTWCSTSKKVFSAEENIVSLVFSRPSSVL